MTSNWASKQRLMWSKELQTNLIDSDAKSRGRLYDHQSLWSGLQDKKKFQPCGSLWANVQNQVKLCPIRDDSYKSSKRKLFWRHRHSSKLPIHGIDGIPGIALMTSEKAYIFCLWIFFASRGDLFTVSKHIGNDQNSAVSSSKNESKHYWWHYWSYH